VVVLIQEHQGKTLKVHGELDEGQKTDQKLFEIIADRYNNTNNKKADGTSINEYHLWGITEMAMTSNLDPRSIQNDEDFPLTPAPLHY
jgi:hypothetical protein